ncbi:rhodanese-like domain-containing protein [Robbsia sp. Bb-Pol-6]|uniref:Rhodanese-like domain-containing protein n=1 Tax=Robbsia betulipollinis TaxID=2981849 RepID=A0ABT3ZIC8_9BURK|nr:rhodanese-like domain-containing protein [Robbsia betulipollinis]MCY0386273.1 rhodanese-like domain-containing protein [Robbsia betulipollinis]
MSDPLLQPVSLSASCPVLDSVPDFAPRPAPNAVTLVPAAPSDVAIRHFETTLQFETDCWDVHEALRADDPGFVLLDVRSAALFESGHVPGAVHLPQGKIVASRLRNHAPDTLFVTYCAGPHCNGAARAAAKLARLGFPVKIMAGGITGWHDEGFAMNVSGEVR